MSHRSVVQLIHDTVSSLSDGIQFGYGQRTDFNQILSKPDLWAWLLPLTANPQFTVNDVEMYQKRWNCIILFCRIVQSGDTEIEQKPVLDDLDELVDKFIHRLNEFYLSQIDTVGPVTLSNFQQTPFFKKDADIFTGWFVTFQMVTPDDFDYCTPENVELYNGN